MFLILYGIFNFTSTWNSFIMASQFAIAVFPGRGDECSETVDIVPEVWLTPNKDHCFWPNDGEPTSKMVRSKCIPNPVWQLYDVRILHEYGKFDA